MSQLQCAYGEMLLTLLAITSAAMTVVTLDVGGSMSTEAGSETRSARFVRRRKFQ